MYNSLDVAQFSNALWPIPLNNVALKEYILCAHLLYYTCTYLPPILHSLLSLSPAMPQMDPLGKVMTAFAAALEVPVSQLQFTFDGDSISPDQTPSGLDMDHDDIIDARLLS